MTLRTPARVIESRYVSLALYGRPQGWLALWLTRVATWRQR